MAQYKALVLDSDACLEDSLRHSAAFPLILNRTTSPDELWQSLAKEEPDVVVLHLNFPNVSGARIVHRLRKLRPQIPALLVLSKPKESDWNLLDEHLDLVHPPFDLYEIQHRIARLLPHSLRASTTDKLSQPLITTLVPDIHNPDSGRIDAKRTADLFGLSVSELARILGKEVSALHKTPDAPTLQSKLFPFARIASALVKLTGSPEAIKIWLNAPNPRLDGMPPIGILKIGKQELIADMLEDALLGHPS